MNDTTLMHRQIHPNFVQLNPLSAQPRATSQAFRPSTGDSALSTYDGDQISAAASWAHYASELGLASCGVMSVTPSECVKVRLSVISDGVPYPEHISISFIKLTSAQIKVASKILSAAANARSWQYRP